MCQTLDELLFKSSARLIAVNKKRAAKIREATHNTESRARINYKQTCSIRPLHTKS